MNLTTIYIASNIHRLIRGYYNIGKTIMQLAKLSGGTRG